MRQPRELEPGSERRLLAGTGPVHGDHHGSQQLFTLHRLHHRQRCNQPGAAITATRQSTQQQGRFLEATPRGHPYFSNEISSVFGVLSRGGGPVCNNDNNDDGRVTHIGRSAFSRAAKENRMINEQGIKRGGHLHSDGCSGVGTALYSSSLVCLFCNRSKFFSLTPGTMSFRNLWI